MLSNNNLSVASNISPRTERLEVESDTDMVVKDDG